MSFVVELVRNFPVPKDRKAAKLVWHDVRHRLIWYVDISVFIIESAGKPQLHDPFPDSYSTDSRCPLPHSLRLHPLFPPLSPHARQLAHHPRSYSLPLHSLLRYQGRNFHPLPRRHHLLLDF